MPEYPQRSSHWAHKLTRLVWRACTAQEIGLPASYLVVQIAHTEDAKRYSGPVTYWNGQLESLMGLSWDQLNRVRQKAVDAGWLYYERGGKGKVGKYWTMIPPAYADLSDNPVDEDFVHPGTDGEPVLSAQVRIQAGDNGPSTRTEADRSLIEAGDKPGTNPEHSTLRPKPNPGPTNARSTEPNPDEAAFATEFWPNVPRRVGKQKALAAFITARKRLSGQGQTPAEARAHLVERMLAFGASPKASGRYCPHPSTWLNEGRYDDDPTEWERTDGKTSSRGHQNASGSPDVESVKA